MSNANATLEVGHPAASENDFNAHVGLRILPDVPSCDSAPCGVESGSGAAAARRMRFSAAMRVVGVKPPYPPPKEALRIITAALVFARTKGDNRWAAQLSQAKETVKFRALNYYCDCGERKQPNAKSCRMCYDNDRRSEPNGR